MSPYGLVTSLSIWLALAVFDSLDSLDSLDSRAVTPKRAR
jgi:hypothetical protein